MLLSTILKYPILTLLSTGKKNFEDMGRFMQRSGDTVKRLLCPEAKTKEACQQLCCEMFRNKKWLCCIIDDTLLRKIYSQLMQGSGWFYDTKISRRIMAYRLVIGLISDGRFTIPIECAYLFSKELLDLIDHDFQTKDEIAKSFVKTAINLFPQTKIIVTADGLYATVEFIKWCKEQKIPLEVRMHSNRVIMYKGQQITLKNLVSKLGLRPKGRKMFRTITAVWHELELEITIVRRIDKKGNETIVFQAATYKTLPREHVKFYKIRWKVEKNIRTTKQKLGLQECQSRSLQTQHDHVSAVLLAYALSQLEMKKNKLETPEKAIRHLKMKNMGYLIDRFLRLDQIFGDVNV